VDGESVNTLPPSYIHIYIYIKWLHHLFFSFYIHIFTYVCMYAFAANIQLSSSVVSDFQMNVDARCCEIVFSI
jgi:hypothetical protein